MPHITFASYFSFTFQLSFALLFHSSHYLRLSRQRQKLPRKTPDHRRLFLCPVGKSFSEKIQMIGCPSEASVKFGCSSCQRNAHWPVKTYVRHLIMVIQSVHSAKIHAIVADEKMQAWPVNLYIPESLELVLVWKTFSFSQVGLQPWIIYQAVSKGVMIW